MVLTEHEGNTREDNVSLCKANKELDKIDYSEFQVF